MYHTVDTQTLSPKQISRILNGHPVRVKMGSGAKMHVSTEHAKKLHRAYKKGGAATVTLDPYAIEHNQHLRTHVGRIAHKARGGTLLIDQPFTTRQAVNTTGKFFTNPGKTLGFGFEGPLPYDKSKVPRGMKGNGFFEDIGKIAKSAGKTVIKKLANEVVDFAGPVAGSAFAAAATASGNPEFAPAAAILGNELGSRAGRYANSKIQGMGKRRGGTLLIDEPITARQVVNTTGKFFTNPGKTLGFGAKRKRVMSEAQKAALAKGRSALRIKLNEMGAGHGGAARPAGYGVEC